MNQVYVDAVSADGDVLGTTLITVFLDDDGRITPEDPHDVRITARRSFIISSVVYRAVNGRCLGREELDPPLRVRRGERVSLLAAHGFIRIIPE